MLTADHWLRLYGAWLGKDQHAMFTIHIHHGFSAVNTIGITPEGPLFGPPGYEINLLYIAGLIALMLTGAGRFSVDRAIRRTAR